MKDLSVSSNARLMRISGKYDELSNEIKPIVFLAIKDLLPKKEKGEVGFNLTKLMYQKDAEKKEKGIIDDTYDDNNVQIVDDMIKQVAEDTYYVMRYIYDMDDEKNDVMAGIRKMFTQKTITDDNNFIDYLADYFSVSQDVIKEGFGVKYKIDYKLLKKHIKKDVNIDDAIVKYLDEIVANSEEERQEVKENLYKIIISSDILSTDCIGRALNISLPNETLIEEDVFLCFECGYLLYYADWLNEQQLMMVENLIDNIYKFVLGKKINKNGYPE